MHILYFSQLALTLLQKTKIGGVIMATITLKYDTKNDLAANIISSIKSTGVFTIVEEKSPYNKEFVKKIQKSRKSRV